MNAQANTTTTQAAILRKIGGPLEIESIDIAPPRADEVLVRLAGVGICHTDITCRDGFPVPLPIVLGHEGAGIVAAVGTDVTHVKVGDSVVLAFNSCGSCHACASEHPAACAQFLPHNFAGVRLSDGSSPLSQNGTPVSGLFFGQSSFAGYAIAREINTIAVRSNLPLDMLGPLGCGVMTGAGAAINSLRLGPGQSLAIFGGGTVGLSALLGARAVGVEKVFVVEPSASRRALALELGATQALDPRAAGDVVEQIKASGGVHHALDTTAIPTVIAQAMNSVLSGGTVGLIGIPSPEAAIPATLLDLLVKNVTLKPIVEGDANPRTFIPRMLDLQAQGKFPFERLIAKFPFARINEAMHASEKAEVVKAVLVF